MDSGIFQLRNNGHGGRCLRIKGYATAIHSSMFQNLGKLENNRYISKAKFGRIACTNLQIMPRTIYIYFECELRKLVKHGIVKATT